VGRNAEELVRKVKAFIHVRNNPTQACPAKWDEGSKTLDLNKAKDMVGKVGDFS
jgi:alkyl hydroperoxide reductase subunit AhpC